jgi:ubiquinone/menaquinone biosynthesis C-methylase UbiE
LINSQQPDKGSILDIGAGTGDFLAVAKEWLENSRSGAE